MKNILIVTALLTVTLTMQSAKVFYEIEGQEAVHALVSLAPQPVLYPKAKAVKPMSFGCHGCEQKFVTAKIRNSHIQETHKNFAKCIYCAFFFISLRQHQRHCYFKRSNMYFQE